MEIRQLNTIKSGQVQLLNNSSDFYNFFLYTILLATKCGFNFINSRKAVGRRMNKHRVRTVVLSAVVAGSLLIGANAGAADLKDILKEGVKANKLAQQSQQRINANIDKTFDIVADYTAVLKTVEGLQIYNERLRRQIKQQEDNMAEIRKSIRGVTVVKRQIAPLMKEMVYTLEIFINKDIPFKLEERLAGIERLKDMMDDPKVDDSEKFRSVFELYQIESDYGRAMHPYTDVVNVNGTSREVDVLMIGRVALLYQTRDGLISGAWDHEASEWKIVDAAEYRKSINMALRVALKQAAADSILKLPLSAPEKAK